MSDQFVGEIRIVPFTFAPTGWAFCNGQLLPISQYTAVFSLLGTFYGGDGKSNFALPNLQGSVPVDYGQGPGLSERVIGESGGETSVQLLSNTMPPHEHLITVSNADGNASVPSSAVMLAYPGSNPHTPSSLYEAGTVTTSVPLHPSTIGFNGGNAAHNNMQPYLVLNFIIALQGVFPPRS